MTTLIQRPGSLKQVFTAMREGAAGGRGADYTLRACYRGGFAAVSKSGSTAFVLPLAEPPVALARSAAGCSLTPVPVMDFQWGPRTWREPAAVLVCDDASLAEAFFILAEDVAVRTRSDERKPNWKDVAGIVDEWQSLLAKRKVLSSEESLGLWGELWVIDRAAGFADVLAGWRGPEGAPVDFLVNGIGVEVKTTRRKARHHFSQTQVNQPLGDVPTMVLSLWVGLDPVKGVSLPGLVDRVLERCAEPAQIMRGLSAAGYSLADAMAYRDRYVVLGERWYRESAIPRIRAVDPGVERVRYEVDLSDIPGIDVSELDQEWMCRVSDHHEGTKR